MQDFKKTGFSASMDVMHLKAVLRRVLSLGVIWVVLSGTEIKALVFGVAIVPAAVWLSLQLIPAQSPLRLWELVRHIPVFIWGSLRGGFDVALRAFSPAMELRPGWVKVPVAVDDGGRVALCFELSLMPGTLSVGMRDGKILVHLLDKDAGFEDGIPQTGAAIAAMIGQSDNAEERS